jgi:hypothetical protein
MKPLRREWVEKAEGDFMVATQIMRRRNQRIYDAACFHCQQAVEKYFKARLAEAALPFPRTHDLPALLHLLLPIEPLWKSYEPTVKALTDCGELPVSRGQCHAGRSKSGAETLPFFAP